MDAISVADLVVDRGRRRVLHGLTLGVPAGQVTGLLGPSGSGKTTLMRALVGVQILRSGEVTVLGEPAGSPALRSRVGYVTQVPGVYADLTVRENARYFASLYGMSAREADAVGQLCGTSPAASRAGCPSPAPSWALPRYWSWMNPPWDWIRSCGWSSGRGSTTWPRPGRR